MFFGGIDCFDLNKKKERKTLKSRLCAACIKLHSLSRTTRFFCFVIRQRIIVIFYDARD